MIVEGCWLNSEDIALESLLNSSFEVKEVINICLTEVYLDVQYKVRRYVKSNVRVV